MDIKVGSIVRRKSYDCDVAFVILELNNNIAVLKGMDIRLLADAPIEDLVLTDRGDDYTPLDEFNMDRDEYFYLPGKILHIDGDADYLKKSMDYYKKCGVYAVGLNINESEIKNRLMAILREVKPDILVITGHDAYYNKNNDQNNIVNYKNSANFINAINVARDYEKSHEKLVIIAGACQSNYEALIKSGANFASSPKRVNIHALDPAIIAVNISLTDKNTRMDIKELLNKTKYGAKGIGGIVGNGMMYVGYPR